MFKTAKAAPITPVSPENGSISALRAAINTNPHPYIEDSSKILAGDALINDKRPSLEPVSIQSDVSSDQISVYVVREGDTISTIAEMFDVTENTIRWANNLGAKTALRKDQELIILPISGVKYKVRSGDSLKSVASSFHADESEILSYNNLESAADLKAGLEIIIPNGEIATKSVNKPSNKSIGSSNAKSSGYFIRPVNGGKRTQGIHGHNGVDIGSSLGTPIYAAAGGKVIIAKQGGWNGGYGNYVVISHGNGMQTLYAHLNSVSVSPGESVSQGAGIGTMGTTGKSTGVHLHFEVRGGSNPF